MRKAAEGFLNHWAKARISKRSICRLPRRRGSIIEAQFIVHRVY